MIECYSWPTPNGNKVHIMLEECGLEYRAFPVNISKGDQFKPAFLKISPNNKVPAIIDRKGPGGKPMSLFESGAILIYLAEKTGQFLPKDTRGKYGVIPWLMFQMASVGPMFGQAHHFRVYAPKKIDYCVTRYTNEATRIYGVMNRQLEHSRFIASDEYTIADMAIYPWTRQHDRQGQDLNTYPHVKRWYDEIEARPAVQRGVRVLSEYRTGGGPMSAQTKEIMFGATQYKRRKVA
jgi:GST-like protein